MSLLLTLAIVPLRTNLSLVLVVLDAITVRV